MIEASDAFPDSVRVHIHPGHLELLKLAADPRELDLVAVQRVVDSGEPFEAKLWNRCDVPPSAFYHIGILSTFALVSGSVPTSRELYALFDGKVPEVLEQRQNPGTATILVPTSLITDAAPRLHT